MLNRKLKYIITDLANTKFKKKGVILNQEKLYQEIKIVNSFCTYVEVVNMIL